MLQKSTPSHRRRTCGRLLVGLASFVVGYAAWAAEPSTPALADVATAPTNSMRLSEGQVRTVGNGRAHIDERQHEIRGPKLAMMLGPDAKMSFTADRVSRRRQDGVAILEGHVRIEATFHVVSRAPSGQVTQDNWRGAIVEGERVVITPQANGDAKVEIENGLIRDL